MGLIGTPEKIAEDIVTLARVGLAGMTLSFFDFTAELPFFVDGVLPLMQLGPRFGVK
jgi:alkanesulfonate monooxygenase SsuD/methylene tetrahydromethanopterin reductase-like flavin-dependent oxidoreductase (luciferase family)